MKKILFFLVILIPLASFAQGDAKKKAYYFYGEQCPHCKTVDEYFQANGIYEKYDITKLEFSNPFNTRLLIKFGDVFKSEYKGSVPAIAFGDKFLVGDKPIMDNFEKEIDAAQNANELPDPDKISIPATGQDAAEQIVETKSEDSESLPDASAQEGNKNKYFPVVLVALVIVGAGALLFINRKPKE